MDKIKLDLARQETAARGLSNVEFRLLDVGDWDEPGGYDVYCRFLLQHLSQPVGLLRRMWAGVRPGVFSSPRTPISMGGAVMPNDRSDFFVRTYSQVLQRRGRDHATC